MPWAGTTRVKEPVQTRSSRTGGRRRRPVLPLAAGGALVLAILWAGSFTPSGRFATAYVFVVLSFYIGVITLVALSLSVMAGLVSTDRILLRIGHRVLFQGIHRALSVVAVVALGVHIAVKVLAGHAALGDVVVPFFSQGRSLFIGFGTIASYLMLVAVWSGLARTRFIGSVRPWLWRVLHCGTYLCWLTALAHGLNAGRPAATWVTVSYAACVVGVALALLVRVYTRFSRYSPGAKTDRAVGANARPAFMTGFRDLATPMPAPVTAPRSPVPAPRSPVPAPRSPVDAYSEPRYEPAAPTGYADPPYGGQGRDSWTGRPPLDYPDEDYPDAAYRTDGYREPYHHDYWDEDPPDRADRKPSFGRWVPKQQRPRLRLVTNNEAAGGPRHSRPEPRGRYGEPGEDYRAG